MLRDSPGHCLVFLIGQLSTGGSERQLYYLLQTLDRARYRPAVVVWSYDADAPYVRDIYDLGVPVYSLSPATGLPAKLRSLRRLVRRIRPQVVHSYSFFINAAAAFSVLGTGAVAVGSVRGDYEFDVRRGGLGRGVVNARWPHVQIFNSASALTRSRSRLYASSGGVVIRNGLDLHRFRAEKHPARAAMATVLGVGTLYEWKRWDRLLAATARLTRRGLRFRVQIAGGGPMRAHLEAMARNLQIEDRVEFLGSVASVEQCLRGAAFLAHPSDSEGCPNAVMEAMACGRAVVATDAGDLPMLVEHGKTGLVVRRHDDEAFSEAMRLLLERDDTCRAMGDAGRQKAEREFGLDRLVSETLKAYRAAGWREPDSTAGRPAGISTAPGPAFRSEGPVSCAE